MKIDLDQFRDAFFEEAAEHIARIESALLELEERPDDQELLNDIFRAAHSIKGASGTFGFTDVARFTHVLENLLDHLREGRVRFDHALGDVLLRANDVLKELIAAAKVGAGAPAEMEEVMADLERAIGAVGGDASSGAKRGDEHLTPPTAAVRRSLRVTFLAGEDLFLTGMDPLLLLRDLRAAGDVCQVALRVERMPSLAALDPERCYLGWAIDLATELDDAALRDIFSFVEDSSEIRIEALDGGEAAAAHPSSGTAVAHGAKPAEPAASGDGRAGHPAAGGRDPEATARRHTSFESSSIRVPTDKVDRLINLVGELVIAQSMITQVVQNFTEDKLLRLQEAVAEMERNTRELQERVMAVRMVPIGATFSRFPRLVRDLASSFGKKITLQTVGEETELDKGVVERIGDPLTHLIRNAVDHGIEAPADRLAAGKPEEGHIVLRAFHEGGSVAVEIADDGAGLNTARIREKAIATGLLAPDADVSDEHVHSLIFEPGFSTAQTVTDVSGRGVGMDVVRKNIEALGGTVAIQSERGRGTRFRIRLPLTLAILDGLLLRVGEETYIFPLVSIIESLRPSAENLRTVLGKGEIVVVRGEFVPLLRLHRIFDTTGHVSNPTEGLVVLVENEGQKLGILADEILGQSQVVIKNLEANYRKVEGLMGATIMGDGRVALILDVQSLARLSERGRAGEASTNAPLTNAARSLAEATRAA